MLSWDFALHPPLTEHVSAGGGGWGDRGGVLWLMSTPNVCLTSLVLKAPRLSAVLFKEHTALSGSQSNRTQLINRPYMAPSPSGHW